VSPNNKLVIDVPLRKPPANGHFESSTSDHRSLTQFDQYRDPLLNNAGSLDDSNLQPRIVNKGNNQKQLEVTVRVKNYRLEELQVSGKNNELIVQGEHQHKDDNRSERSFFFK
jgi:HSP20 family molecular chaperone IbpA